KERILRSNIFWPVTFCHLAETYFPNVIVWVLGPEALQGRIRTMKEATMALHLRMSKAWHTPREPAMTCEHQICSISQVRAAMRGRPNLALVKSPRKLLGTIANCSYGFSAQPR